MINHIPRQQDDSRADRARPLVTHEIEQGEIASARRAVPSATDREFFLESPVRGPAVLMLLTNAYDPDPRVRQEALALIKMGCTVKLLAWDRDLKCPPLEHVEGVEIERIFVRSRHGRGSIQLLFYALVYLQLLWKGWRISFDVVHCHDLDTLPLGFLLGKLKRRPIVYDAHESFPDMLDGNVPRVVLRGLFNLENLLIQRIDLLITVGEKLRKHFASRGASHSAVVGNWKRLEDFARSKEENLVVRRRLGIPDSALVLVCITQLFIDRKIEELLESIEKCPDVYLIIGGRGALEEAVISRAAKSRQIRYLGFVRASEIPSFTCAADVVYYGFDPENPNARFSAPNKLFEALAAGRPLITGDFGEIAEVVRQASCGIVLSQYSVEEIKRAIDQLRDEKVRRRLAENARQCGLNSLNWRHAEEVLRREYSAILKRPLRPASRPEG